MLEKLSTKELVEELKKKRRCKNGICRTTSG